MLRLPSEPSDVLVDISGLSKRFGATQALDLVDLQVTAGSVLALLGQNGAGKSTLIKILAGVYIADAGSISVLGQPLHGIPPVETISFIHQDLGLVDGLSVSENVALGSGYPRRRGLIDWREARRRTARALEMVGSSASPKTRVADLGRTEKSLLAIARALVVDARVLILDEPTASLPVDETERLFAVLRRLRDDGLGLVYVSHRLDDVFEIADRMVVLRDGRVVDSGPMDQTTPEEVVTAIVGRSPLPPPPPVSREAQPPVLVVAGLVSDRMGPVSLQVRGGEVLGLVGLAGAGQSELGRAVAGISAQFAGSMTLGGEPYKPGTVHGAVTRGVGFVTSNRADEGMAGPMTVTENLYPNPGLHGATRFTLRRPRAERRRAAELVERFGVRPRDPELPVEGLSGGNQQKVILGRWLSTSAGVLVLEEPTAGVDVGAKREIYLLLDDALDRGVAVLLISTDIEEVAAVCHRALVFRDGRIVDELGRTELTAETLVARTTGAAA